MIDKAFYKLTTSGEATTVEAVAGDTVNMEIAVGGSANIYTWVMGEETVVGLYQKY